LRSYVNPLHDDWDKHVGAAEFATNCTFAAAHGMKPAELVFHHTPFSPPDLALFRASPLRTADPVGLAKPTAMTRKGRKYSISWVTRLASARSLLQIAKSRMADLANRKRVSRNFAVGDLVLLNTKTYNLKKPTRSLKFLPRFAGPFKIIGLVGPSAYRVERPEGCLIHDVIHVSKLWPYRSDSRNTPPATVLLEHAEHFVVHAILASRGTGKTKTYLVQWKGYDALHNTWEPAENLVDTCSEAIKSFEKSKTDVQALRSECFSISFSKHHPLTDPNYLEIRPTSRTRPLSEVEASQRGSAYAVS